MPDNDQPELPQALPASALAQLPRDELKSLAEEFGLEPGRYRSHQQLAAAVAERRQQIAAMDRTAMLQVIKWGRRPVPLNADKEQLAQEIVRIRSMRFAGLDREGLAILACLRGVRFQGGESASQLISLLKKQEGLLARLSRKRRSLLGALVSSALGEQEGAGDYQFLPPQAGASGPASIKQEIEEAGLIGGLAGRIRREADSYLNQKMDEIEARIDRKLEEIDQRLAEWRDKEVANRIRILKITLWASVIVAGISLLYSYVKVYFLPGPPPGADQHVRQVQKR